MNSKIAKRASAWLRNLRRSSNSHSRVAKKLSQSALSYASHLIVENSLRLDRQADLDRLRLTVAAVRPLVADPRSVRASAAQPAAGRTAHAVQPRGNVFDPVALFVAVDYDDRSGLRGNRVGSQPTVPGFPSSLCSGSPTAKRESQPFSTTRSRALTSEAIEKLLGAQIVMRNNRRLETAMRASRLPAVKTLAQFDFAFQPSIKCGQIESLHELGFLAGPRRCARAWPPKPCATGCSTYRRGSFDASVSEAARRRRSAPGGRRPKSPSC